MICSVRELFSAGVAFYVLLVSAVIIIIIIIVLVFGYLGALPP